jgi:hypothetical protein
MLNINPNSYRAGNSPSYPSVLLCLHEPHRLVAEIDSKEEIDINEEHVYITIFIS